MLNMNQMMKQVQSMQKKMAEAQEKMAVTEFEGTAGGDIVKIVINGDKHMKSVKIDPSVSDTELLEDLIVAAYNDARSKAENASNNLMGDMMSGMNLPAGFKMPFGS